ncbi:MAG TPA: hypothetical protein VGO67_05625 [Verrucomicrobiae bacterium]|jgi:hypothetical protein
MNSKPLYVVVLFCIQVLSATAADKIEGAFGKKLGELFDVTSAVGQSQLTDGTPMYEFTPTNAFRSLKKYYVFVTPTTKKIYSIWGTGPTENTETGKKEQALIMEILQEKYGEKSKPGLLESIVDADIVDQGNRYVMSKVSGFSDVTIDVRYYDRDLEQLAEKERIAEEAKKVDKKGL